jgi:2'-5' RNA ligase
MSFSKALKSLPGGIHRFFLRALKFLRLANRDRSFEIAYVILVSDEVHNYMSKLQLDIFKRYGANPGIKASPHITLKLGFNVSNIEPFEQYFDQLVDEIEPFEICLRNIGFFDEGIIFMDVEHNPQLETLRRRILNDLSEQHGIKPYPLEGDRYHFHATLAYGMSKHDFARARIKLKDLKVEFRFVLETLGLFCQTGDDLYEWITYKRSVLSRSIARPSRKD